MNLLYIHIYYNNSPNITHYEILKFMQELSDYNPGVLKYNNLTEKYPEDASRGYDFIVIRQ